MVTRTIGYSCRMRMQFCSSSRPSGLPNQRFGSHKLKPSLTFEEFQGVTPSSSTSSQLSIRKQQHACWTSFHIPSPITSMKKSRTSLSLHCTFGLSRREHASHSHHFHPLGDSKTSALMDEMLGLCGDHPPCVLFEQLFLKLLPKNIRIQLVTSSTTFVN